MARPSGIEKAWLIEQFEQIDTANKAILVKVDKIEKALGGPNSLIIPELERTIRKVTARGRAIDLKVKDEE